MTELKYSRERANSFSTHSEMDGNQRLAGVVYNNCPKIGNYTAFIHSEVVSKKM